ncbi:MAG: cobalt-zinc-cadmium efflux system protein [Thermoleophilaceae bacterium]|nr:cobalt-zinc-cadmium efflux system protein [Thermoleophilaceae bacterium]
MALALAINAAMLAAAVAGWLVFDSVALMADAGHVLSDIGAIVLGIAAAWAASRPARGRRTFGLRRAEIFAALANGVVLVAVAVWVFWEAISRLSDSPDVDGAGIAAVGAFGLIGNGVATLILARGDRDDLNLEGVLRHSAADALGSLGALAAGIVILADGPREADAVAALLIGCLILLGSWRLIRDPLDVLLESAPRGVDVSEVGDAICRVDGVREVHDLHIWTVTSGFAALAAHVRTDPHGNSEAIRTAVEALLRERFGITHTTLQTMSQPLLSIEDRRREAGEPE